MNRGIVHHSYTLMIILFPQEQRFGMIQYQSFSLRRSYTSSIRSGSFGRHHTGLRIVGFFVKLFHIGRGLIVVK